MLRGLEAVTDKATAASPYIGIVVYASKFKVLINIKVNNEQCAAPVRAVSCGSFCGAQKVMGGGGCWGGGDLGHAGIVFIGRRIQMIMSLCYRAAKKFVSCCWCP